MAASLTVAVRTLHVLGMAVLLGGAAAVWYLARTEGASGGSTGRADLGALATGYEWVFWGAVGVVVVTGVGNLGAVGAPGPETRWGAIFFGKLLVVVGFVLGSVVRTVAVARLDGAPVRAAFCRRAYGATTGVLLALVVLAEVLAHG